MEKKGTTYGPIEVKPGMVREAVPAYKRKKQQGEFTIEDYYALPDDMRAELIDGVIYNMAAPTSIHQDISAEIFWQLKAYIREKNGKCRVYAAPFDVQLDQDDRTMVEPDLLIACNRDLIKKHVYYGAPNFVVEILSPSTRKKDTWLKLQKYRNAGVREYWIVDLDNKTVTVYDFEHGGVTSQYGFEDQVPVNIYHGECVVDFADIYEQIRFLYES